MIDYILLFIEYLHNKWLSHKKTTAVEVTGLSDKAHCIKVKVKVTLVQALRLCTGRTAHRGSRGITLPFHDHGTSRW